MSLYVLDTDILTLFERGQATVVAHIAEHPPAEISISIVTVEEQLSGWYAQLRKAKSPERLAWAYRRLAANVRFLRHAQILDFDEAAIQRSEELKTNAAQGSQDGSANRSDGASARRDRGHPQCE
jgi:tRNA(fMet)-specific endonuclease VapC